MGLSAAAADNGPAKAEAEKDNHGEKSLREQDIYIPYEKLRQVFERHGRGVFLPYEEFEQLWRAAQDKTRPAAGVRPPVGAVITEIENEATVAKDVVRVKATLKIDLLAEGWHEIPLRLADAAITAATLRGEPARIVGGPGEDYKLLVEKKGKEPEQIVLALEYAKAISKMPGQNSVSFQAPQAPVSRWRVRIPQAGVKVNLSSADCRHGSALRRRGQRDGKTEHAGKKDEAEAGRRRRDRGAGLRGRGADGPHRLDAQGRGRHGPGRPGERRGPTAGGDPRGGHQQPRQAGLHDQPRRAGPVGRRSAGRLQGGQRLRRQRAAVVGRAAGRRRPRRRRSPCSSSSPPRSSNKSSSSWRNSPATSCKRRRPSPVVKALDVGRQQGVVVVEVAAGLRAEATRTTGLLQVDAGELPEAMRRQAWTFSYRYAAVPYELVLGVEKVQPRVTAESLVEAGWSPSGSRWTSTRFTTSSGPGSSSWNSTCRRAIGLRHVHGCDLPGDAAHAAVAVQVDSLPRRGQGQGPPGGQPGPQGHRPRGPGRPIAEGPAGAERC